MKSVFKLIRVDKLLIIAVLQYFIHYFFIGPILRQYGLQFYNSDLDFALMVFMTLSITAAGYIINDYFDLKIDYVNRPNQVLVGKAIPRRIAMFLHFLLSSVGVLIGLYLSWRMKALVVALAPALTVGLLWFYSTEYKRQFLLGNLVIALLAVFPIFFTIIFEPSIFYAYHDAQNQVVALLIFKVLGFYACIAFAVALIFSLIKDLHDYAGDEMHGFRTLPIVAGRRASFVSIHILSAFVIFALFYIQNLQYQNGSWVPLLFLLFGMQVPIGLVNLLLYFQKDHDNYSTILKILSAIMVMGVVSILVLNFFS